MHIIAVTNQKGGAGKTTTAAALAAGLTNRGYKSLMVDLDPQANLTFTAGADTDGPSALGLLTREAKAADAIQHTEATGDIIPASRGLAGAAALITGTGQEYRLREALDGLEYDYIIIDTPPALGVLTVNALTACDSVIIPAQADIYSLQGIEQLADTIKPVKQYCNPALHILGILLTRYSSRSILSRDIAELAGQLAEKLGTRLFNTTIREAVAIREAQLMRQTIFDYAPRSNVAADYNSFLEEVIEAIGGKV